MASYLLGGQGGMAALSTPTFTPTGRGGISSFLYGTPESYFTTPGRAQLYEQLARGTTSTLPRGFDFLSRLLSGDESIYRELEAPALRQFQEQIVPGLAERFTAMGQGAQGSSAYQQQLLQAGSRLAQDLAGQRAGYRMSALDRLLQQAGQTAQTSPYDFVPRTPGFLETMSRKALEIAPMMMGAI